MSGSQAEIDGGVAAARRVAADPAFSALEASGAPLLAAIGDPLEIVYMNAAARNVFGADARVAAGRLFQSAEPGARRLSELVDSVRHGAALRLERLSFDLADGPRTVTILCRQLAADEGPALFVVAALGMRSGAPVPEPIIAAEAPPDASPAPPPIDATRAALIERHGRAPRFLWKTDAAGRFVDVTRALADVAGDDGADLVGRAAHDVAAALGLDSAFADAIATQRSWSGVAVDWPIGAEGLRAPATLGALPVFDADRRFAGFQGYGVLHLDRLFREAPRVATAPATGAPAPAPVEANNVVRLWPPAPMRVEAPATEAGEPTGADEALTSREQENFEEIARALRSGVVVEPAPENAGAIEADVSPAAGVAPGRADDAFGALIDRLPVGVLVARGTRTLYANHTLLDYLGYADADAFDADGGLARMFFGRPPGAGAAAVQSSDGEALDVDLHLQTIDWDGEAATLVTLRRNRRLPGPQESALALAREREEKLARAGAENHLLRDIVETSAVAVALLGEDGRIESATAAFAALLDSDRAAVEGLALGALLVADDSRGLPLRLARAAETGETLPLSTRVGGRALEASARRLGPAQRLCVTLREPMARHEELEAARVAAEQASAAKSDFLARISHEIRTPLNAILGFAEVMMEERFGPVGSERYKEYLKDVHASGAHVLSLVNDLLDLSKIEAGKMELEFDRVDANAVISECASIMQTQANQARIVMRLSLAPRLPPIRADRRSLKQILLNLLSNALKFNEPGGQVIVSSALTDAGYVVIRVKDTGIGMSDDEVQLALEPFKQVATAQKRNGTGLGLPLTKALIEANHASFTIRSRKSEGTLVEIAFPPPQVLAAE
jgi:signal transduction histidine kinase